MRLQAAVAIKPTVKTKLTIEQAGMLSLRHGRDCEKLVNETLAAPYQLKLTIETLYLLKREKYEANKKPRLGWA